MKPNKEFVDLTWENFRVMLNGTKVEVNKLSKNVNIENDERELVPNPCCIQV